jgi:predicted nucleotidyltransferase
MQDDIAPIIATVKDALLRKLGDEVELIFQYGSHLKGAAHKYSDVDISYVPLHDSTGESVTVMLGETLIDLYPMRWSHLERMAEFRDLSSAVLVQSRIVYQRNEAAAERFRALGAKLRALQQPEALPQMIRRAQEIFQEASYPHDLLRQEAAAGYWPGCVQQALSILRTTLHFLAVLNQSLADTRKLPQVLALHKLPAGLAEIVERITQSCDPAALLSACDALLAATRGLLLAEQRRVLRQPTTYAQAIDCSYPELRADLNHVLLSCERRDMLALKTALFSFYQELALVMAQVSSEVEYSGFNALSEYEQGLTALGFPALLPYLPSGDYERIYQQATAFAAHLERFLGERGVALNRYASLEELRAALESN